MMNILQVILVLVIFFPTKYLTWKITEVWGLPTWLNYKPWNCNLCLTFWSLLALFIACGLLCHLWITMAVGGLITVLNAIAMYINQKNKTVVINIDEENKIIELKRSDYEMDK